MRERAGILRKEENSGQMIFFSAHGVMASNPILNSDMQTLISRDGTARYCPNFIAPDLAQALFERLSDSLDWREEEILIFGKWVKVPRLMCWHGDAGALYRYSGVIHEPLPWTADLAAIRALVEAAAGQRFNSVLGNFYRDGQDSMGWHADQEPELGENPCIASLSLGQARRFRLRHNRSGETLDLRLHSGSLLLMGGALQHHWRHCVPKTQAAQSARINLTFRMIFPQHSA
jgi:alkylated DNA repair dioxygenase AlkB